MDEQEAKSHLTQILECFTTGSILHLLGELMADAAEQKRKGSNVQLAQQYECIEQTLFVVGLGIDAALPSGSSTERHHPEPT